MTTLSELIKELRANGVLEYKGKLNGEEVFLRLLAANTDVPAAEPKRGKTKPAPKGSDGMTQAEQIALYGQAFTEDFS